MSTRSSLEDPVQQILKRIIRIEAQMLGISKAVQEVRAVYLVKAHAPNAQVTIVDSKAAERHGKPSDGDFRILTSPEGCVTILR
jgi:hypothetical protein